MFGAMQMYQMQAMEQHLAQKEARRRLSASHLVRMTNFFRRDLAVLGEQLDETFENVQASSGSTRSCRSIP